MRLSFCLLITCSFALPLHSQQAGLRPPPGRLVDVRDLGVSRADGTDESRKSAHAVLAWQSTDTRAC